MYGLLILLGIVALVVLYFCFGIAVKFLVGWFPVILGGIVTVAMLIFGSVFWQIIGILLFGVTVNWSDRWHRSDAYLAIEKKLDELFYFKD